MKSGESHERGGKEAHAVRSREPPGVFRQAGRCQTRRAAFFPRVGAASFLQQRVGNFSGGRGACARLGLAGDASTAFKQQGAGSMRIAVVTEFFYPTLGGVQEHVFHLARECRRLGHSVTIVTSRVDAAGSSRTPSDVNVVRMGPSMPVQINGSVGRVSVGWTLAPELERLLVADNFDVVHVHAPLTPVLPVLAIRRTSLPIVGTYHTNFGPSRLLSAFRGACQGLVNRIDANVAVSSACIRALSDYVRAPFQIIPNGVDCAAFAAGRPLPRLAGEHPVVLFIGRLEQRSGLDRLLRAWPLVSRAVKARLVVIGDGPDRRHNQALAAEVGADAVFAGARHPDRPDWFASADLLVCPTTIASFGVTLLEGMAAGLPVVASDIDGFREVLTDGHEGRLVDTSDETALSDAIIELLTNPRLRKKMAAAGRATARRYDWPNVAEQVVDVYRQLTRAP